MRIRYISLVLVIILVCTAQFSVPAGAEEIQQVCPRYTYIDTVAANLSINSSTGLATCSGTGCAKGTDDVVSLTVQLQQYKNSTWHTLKTWNGSNTNMAVVSGQYYVYKGYTYRTKVTETVYDKNGNFLESTSCTHEQNY